jgi:hypothetical protein
MSTLKDELAHVAQSGATMSLKRRWFRFALSSASRRSSLRSRWLQRRLQAMWLARTGTNGATRHDTASVGTPIDGDPTVSGSGRCWARSGRLIASWPMP